MQKPLSRTVAGLLICLMLAGCAHGEENLVSGDAPSTTPMVSEDSPLTGSYMISQYPELTATDDTASAEEPEETEPVETTSAGESWTLTAYSATMYSIDILNVREQPSTEAKIVGQLNPGDEVKVVGYTSNGWYKIKYDGSEHFVSAEFLSDEKPEVEREVFAVPEGYRFQTDDDYFFVVNKDRHLPEDYEIETDFVQGSYELEAVAAQHCREMIEAAKKEGIELKVLSAYRTVEYQKNLFERNVKSRMEEYGMSYDEAYYDVSINIAPPGGSEHNAGLAVDIIDTKHWDTYEEFENTKEFKWLIEHCTEYGFILRYPNGKEDITGYIYEPWHYRYVGLNNAEAVMASGLCLEEYCQQVGSF